MGPFNIMFDEFVKVSIPGLVGCAFMFLLVPGLFALIPLAVGVGVVWTAFNVARGFATGDYRREKEDW